MPMRLAVLLSMIVACAPRVAAVRAKAGDYYPLRPGSTWVYEGKLLADGATKTVVLGPREADGFFADDSGAKLMYDGEGLRDQKRYLLREPLRIGTQWRSTVEVGVTEIYEIVSVRAPCKVLAGSFPDCIEVLGKLAAPDGSTLENRMTFAKGVGLVRLATARVVKENRTPQVVMELKTYRIAE